jgi:hypothetical protein
MNFSERSFSTEFLDPPIGYMVSLDDSKRRIVQEALKRNSPRAFLVTEDGDIIIGATEFHKNIVNGRSREYKVLDKGTIIPKSKKINFIYSDNFKSSLSREDRIEEQQKVRDAINHFLEINFS